MIIIINGDSGAGKTYLLQQLETQENNYIPVKKYTTRSSRTFEDENNSVDLVYNYPKENIKEFKYHYHYKGEHYGIDESELKESIEYGNIPVIIIRSFKTIRKIKNDFEDVMVLFVIGETGEGLNKVLKSQGRDSSEIKRTADNSGIIIRDYIANLDLIDHCLINNLYDKDLYLKQFYYYARQNAERSKR